MRVRYPKSRVMPVGIVVQRLPSVSRWAKHAWKATAVLPGAAKADWKELRPEGSVTEFHAATLPLTLFVSDSEAYAHELQARTPSVYVIMRPNEKTGDRPWQVTSVTASPYEAQDYCDSAEELVEKIAMPDGLRAWITDFVDAHFEEEVFVKRRRKNMNMDKSEDGVGDPRIRQTSDVYRTPQRKVIVN